ncbi:glycosyltransferase family 2 protein [Nitratidesulfovibrio liaohensis]|uniref:Glycosyltransferase family 2 protein n=1 Tax=Nitratidesulfovibrio liaohensis TaxID=2604158 RepID=A0ABY9R4M3_9BACT|nr:glycosyltransferase family 2 protein [Nitratidesulfovibrio liaohensis]WMW66157.1 glycosyltransferase family 2 protein [Nitratidesulfovibrio liaohensis]
MSAAQPTEPHAGAEPNGATPRPAGHGGSEHGGSEHGGPVPVLLSVVVPVLHEGHRIAELAGHVRALAGELPPGVVELVVADGAPECDTLAALKQALGEDAWRAVTGLVASDLAATGLVATGLAPKGLASAGRLVTDGNAQEFYGTGLPVRVVAAPRGRARQMNAGAAVARGQVLLFLHADTRLPEGAFPTVLRALGIGGAEGVGDVGARGTRHADDGVFRDANGVPGAGAFTLGIDAPGAWFRVVETLGNLRNRLTRTPYGDQAQFFRAGVFRSLSGYTDLPLMEDVEIMRRVRRAGLPLALLALRAVTSARRWRDEGAVRCTLRNVCLRLLYALGVPAQILARWYRARKGAS